MQLRATLIGALHLGCSFAVPVADNAVVGGLPLPTGVPAQITSAIAQAANNLTAANATAVPQLLSSTSLSTAQAVVSSSIRNSSLATTSNATAALPATTATSATPSSTGFQFVDAMPRFSNANGSWLHGSCTDPAYNPPGNADGTVRWNHFNTTDAWNQLLFAWNNRNDPGAGGSYSGWSFAQFAFDQFYVDGANSAITHCDQLDATACASITFDCVENSEVGAPIPPAGVIILQSMQQINQLMENQVTELGTAVTQLKGLLPNFQNTFAPAAKPADDTAMTVIGYLMDGLGLLTDGLSSDAFKAVTKLSDDAIETSKTVLEYTQKGLDCASQVLEFFQGNPPESASDIKTDLSNYLDAFNGNMTAATKQYYTNIFNDTAGQLSTLMTSGLFGGKNATQYNAPSDDNSVALIVLGELIQAAWAISPSQNRPFVLRFDKSQMNGDCYGDPQGQYNGQAYAGYFEQDVLDHSRWCDADGNAFFLINGQSDPFCTSVCATGTCTTCPIAQTPFGSLSGGDNQTLSGDNSTWFGLHMNDIIQSSWNQFIANGKTNGGGGPSENDLQTFENQTLFGTAPSNVPAGLFGLTICLDADEALDTLTAAVQNKSAPICGNSPRPGNSNLNNAGTYTPGWCKLHVTQDQSGLSVNVFDGASLLIGDMPKMPGNPSVAIADTPLPYDLIVYSVSESEPIEFWYADQYWDTTSTANACSMGKADHGVRQADCGFSCPAPPSGSNPPAPAVSATIAHPLPNEPITAGQGSTTFANTKPTPTPPSAPTPISDGQPSVQDPAYATGQCGIHVTQTRIFSTMGVEVVIKDAKGVEIGDSGQQIVQLQGSFNTPGLVSPFTTTYVDASSGGILQFSYNGKTWKINDPNSGGCGVGKYDGNTRQMDCGFAC